MSLKICDGNEQMHQWGDVIPKIMSDMKKN